LNANGTVKGTAKIANGMGVGLVDGDAFGASVARAGDFNRDGVEDILVGIPGEDTGGTNRGAMSLIGLTRAGGVSSTQMFFSGFQGFLPLEDGDSFGRSVANLGLVGTSNLQMLAIGAHTDDTGGGLNANRGAVHIVLRETSGFVRSVVKIASGISGGPVLADSDFFGVSVASAGDLDGDGVTDLLVGASGDDTGGTGRGAVYALLLNPSGTVKSFTKLASGAAGVPALGDTDSFGIGVTVAGDIDGDGAVDLAVGAFGADAAGTDRGAVHILRLNSAAALRDFGDAPDGAAGTARGNYNTTNGDNGPSHGIVNGLLLGGLISGESDAAQNATGSGDDRGLDDEDGLSSPATDLALTVGAIPRVAVRATNVTGTAATLFGWIDYNADGVFDNATERAQVAIPTGTSSVVFSLTFPRVPSGFAGTTYARFRLSTDGAAANPTGAASNGEVEDYAATIVSPGQGVVKVNGITKIADNTNGLGSLFNNDKFGAAATLIGDVDGDGIGDLAVGAYQDNGDASARGAIRILFMTAAGTVRDTVRIAQGVNGGPSLAAFEAFGSDLAPLGDFDGDGVPDLVAGGRNAAPGNQGAIYLVLLNANGTAKQVTKLSGGSDGMPTINNGDTFGRSIANLGDVDGDGVVDLAVGRYGFSGGVAGSGAVDILFLNADRTVKRSQLIANNSGGLAAGTLLTNERFGTGLASMGDMDGDGVTELAVGAPGLNVGTAANGGAVHVLFLNSAGTVKRSTKIGNNLNGGPPLQLNERFGISLANIGDLNGDGVNDLAVGASFGLSANSPYGDVHFLMLAADGTVVGRSLVGHNTGGGPTLLPGTYFGTAVENVGDIDGDGVTDLLVAANGDDTGGLDRGAIYLLRLSSLPLAPTAISLSNSSVAEKLPSGTLVGTLSAADPNFGDTATFTLVAGTGSTDNGSFTISGNQLLTNGVFDFETKNSFSILVRATDSTTRTFDQQFTITVTNTNDAPTLDNSGNPFAILGVGSRQSVEMRQGVLISDIPARSSVPNPIADQDAGASIGIAVIDVDRSLGSLQFTLVSNNPQESDWQNIEAAGPVSNTSALLLPANARVRFNTGLIPHHAVGAPFLPLESKLDTALTFRAWDGTSGVAGGRGDASINGGTSAFSVATETAKAYFEARLFRTYNTNAQLNIYTLEAEFNALTANPALVDRSTTAFTGFTVLMSPVPELGTAAVFRMLFGVQFNDDGTETDMGYRYLTTNAGEADILEGLGPVAKRPQRDGTYFREIGDPSNPSDTGVNNRTGVLGYIFTTQQPGTLELTQVYRTDLFPKPTRPGGTPVGSTPTSTRNQEQGDHVYTTNIPFETSRPGTWRVEASRGFARELTPNPTGGPPPAAIPALAEGTSGEARRRTLAVAAPSRNDGSTPEAGVDVARLVAIPTVPPADAPAPTFQVGELEADEPDSAAPFGGAEDETWTTPSLDGLFGDLELLATCDPAW
jgi:hypothetical protein